MNPGRVVNHATHLSIHERQHASRPTAATAGGIDGFSDTFTHRTAGGAIQIAPQIDTYRAPSTPYDRYKRRYAGEKTKR